MPSEDCLLTWDYKPVIMLTFSLNSSSKIAMFNCGCDAERIDESSPAKVAAVIFKQGNTPISDIFLNFNLESEKLQVSGAVEYFTPFVCHLWINMKHLFSQFS